MFKIITTQQQALNARAEMRRLYGLTSEVARASIRIDEVSPEALEKIKEVYAEWRSKDDLAEGEVVRHNGIVYQVIQAHSRQEDWEPEVVPALFKRISPSPEIIDKWRPPTGAHDAYQAGDKVLYAGQVYESLINSNTWSPDEYPAGWKLVP